MALATTVNLNPTSGAPTANPAPATGYQCIVFANDGGTPTVNVSATDPVMVGDTGSGGKAGNAPAPAAGDAAAGKFLKADGTWESPAAGAVASLNSLTGALSLTSSDSSVTITPSGTSINLQAAGGGGGDFVRLAQTILSTTAATLTASLPSGYTQIEIELTAVCDQTGETPIRAILNSDSATDYDMTIAAVSGINQTFSTYNTQHNFYCGNAQGTAVAPKVATTSIKLGNYFQTALYKAFSAVASWWLSSNSQYRQETITGAWNNSSSAATDITFSLDAGNFAAGTVLTVYGLK